MRGNIQHTVSNSNSELWLRRLRRQADTLTRIERIARTEADAETAVVLILAALEADKNG